jgi:hypothetical protein
MINANPSGWTLPRHAIWEESQRPRLWKIVTGILYIQLNCPSLIMTAGKAALLADHAITVQTDLLQYNSLVGLPHIPRTDPIYSNLQAFIMHCLIIVNCAKRAREQTLVRVRPINRI